MSDEIYSTKVLLTPAIKEFQLIYDGIDTYYLYRHDKELGSIQSKLKPNVYHDLLFKTKLADFKELITKSQYELLSVLYENVSERVNKDEHRIGVIKDFFVHLTDLSKKTYKKDLKENIDRAKISHKKLTARLLELNKLHSDDEKIIFKEDEITEYIAFGDGEYYQYPQGIFITNKKHGHSEEELVAKINIKKIELISDKLGLFEPVYNMTYKNLVFNQTRTLKNMTFNELASYLDNDMVVLGDDKTARKILRSIIITDVNNEHKGKVIVEPKTDLFKKGFFYDRENNEVLQNNSIIELNPTDDEVISAIKLVNTIIGARGTAIANECTVFRFMLFSPFSWILKDIGFSRSLYSLVLIGKPQANKTGSIENFSNLYTAPDNIVQTADTVPAFGSKLEESTFPLCIDEALNLLMIDDMEEISKRAIYNKRTRAIQNKIEKGKVDEYLALRLPVFTLNYYTKGFKMEFKRRYKILEYDSSMIISEADKKEFDGEFKPNRPNSLLLRLKYLGKVFVDKFIPYIVEQSDRLIDLEQLVIDILKEIGEEYNTPFIKEMYQIQESSNIYDMDKKELLKIKLSEMFRKSHRKKYGYSEYCEDDFISCANNNEISWLNYTPTKQGDDYFHIYKKGFEKDLDTIIGEKTTIEEAFNLLDIELNQDINKYGFKAHNRGNVRGITIEPFDLIYKMFGIIISEHKTLIEQEEIKHNKQVFQEITESRIIKNMNEVQIGSKKSKSV